ncbi:MAG: D-alanyl-D-alanine carboxypeptidase/D-alanyl-D-alanine-endopeptidase [Proteobacteria bacterium]|nr:D-alanyl-D-alanine carboxypeptidase/D-alanyl-D-alanine-endopeptidase [Pseudomonadota bacterium]
MKRLSALCVLILALAGCASEPTRAPAPATIPAQSLPAVPNAASPRIPQTPFAQSIDAFLAQPRFAHAGWGIDVVSLDSGETLYAHEADQLFVPASNAKLYTAALALATLGSDARFDTALYATAAPRGGTLAGDLILRGGGDPSLGDTSPDWAARFASALSAQGMRRIHGDLIADDTWFAGPSYGDGWEAGDLQAWFGAAASALSVQGNVLRVRVSRTGARCCNVALDGTGSGLRIVNLTGAPDPARGSADTLGLYRPPGADTLYASGSLPPGVNAHVYPLSVPDPALLAGTLLRDALLRAGIALDGRVRVLHWPQGDTALAQPGTQRIAAIDSPPLSDLVTHMLKHSDNLYAQVLLQQAGVRLAQGGACADRSEAPFTSAEWGLCGMRAMLARAGIPDGGATFADGAGLSRKDLVSPLATVRLLAWITRQSFASVFRDALPVAAVDGTLRNRMRDTPAAGNLQAKTGTLTHSSALSGYVTDISGRHLAFSLMLDRYERPSDGAGHPVPPSPNDDLDAIAAIITQANP